jgi:hypothetical protein
MLQPHHKEECKAGTIHFQSAVTFLPEIFKTNIAIVNNNNTYLQASSWKYSLATTWHAAARVSSQVEPSAAKVKAKPPELENTRVRTTASGANK